MTVDAQGQRGRSTLAILRGALLGILVVGLIGVLAELLLLEHVEDYWQRAPVFLIVATLIVLAWHAGDRGPLSVRVLQGAMALFVTAGILGVMLHFKGNVEFELEMQPSARGLSLFGEAMMGATPILAPGTMMLLGLVGLAYTFRHPALRGGARGERTHAVNRHGEDSLG